MEPHPRERSTRHAKQPNRETTVPRGILQRQLSPKPPTSRSRTARPRETRGRSSNTARTRWTSTIPWAGSSLSEPESELQLTKSRKLQCPSPTYYAQRPAPAPSATRRPASSPVNIPCAAATPRSRLNGRRKQTRNPRGQTGTRPAGKGQRGRPAQAEDTLRGTEAMDTSEKRHHPCEQGRR